MTHLALYDPSTLLAREFRKLLDETTLDFTELSALTSDEDEVGNLVEIAGSAVRVEILRPEAVTRADLVVCASSTFEECGPLLAETERLAPNPPVLLMAPNTPFAAGQALVEGVNLEDTGGSIMISPCASVVLVAQILTQLSSLRPNTADVTVLQPATTLGEAGLQEVFGQARALLTFDSNLPKQIFGRQVAFSTSVAELGGVDQDRQLQLDALLAKHPFGGPGTVALQTLQTGSLHGLGLSVSLRFDSALEDGSLENRLKDLGPAWQLGDLAQFESTIDRADDPVASIEVRSAHANQVWLWVAADNLIHGNARNTVAIVEAWTTAQDELPGGEQ